MARRRTLWKKISLSEQVNDMSEFAQLLYTWMIPHADDFGRLSGESRVVRGQVIPLSDRSVADVDSALEEMVCQALIERYKTDEGLAVQIIGFDKHQQGLSKRTSSEFAPPPSDSGSDPLSCSETDLEDLICLELDEGRFILSDERLIQIERQYRLGNSYVDILCHDEAGRVFLVEVKRQRLSNSSLQQIIRYARLLEKSGQTAASALLIGHGLAGNFDMELAKEQSINVITYDDQLEYRQVLSIDVSCRWLPLATEEKRREEKGNEGNGTEAQSDRRPFSQIFTEVTDVLVATGVQAEEIDAWMEDISEDWFRDACKEAVDNNARKWAYVRAILERWSKEGKQKRGSHKRSRATDDLPYTQIAAERQAEREAAELDA